ncbi:MAG TPA: type II secretion system protein [Ramlibacter sp.]|uniref:type II secretion system protein n=1 Tax=Ramlibacter sp. TaxID=1917967 RepID=UPI002ED26FAE
MKRARGFTLMELLVTVAILAILAGMAVPTVELAARRSKEQELRTELRRIREALDAYKRAVDDGRLAAAANESGYPKSLQALVDGVENVKDPKKGKLYFLRRVPRDPFAGEKVADAADTWGLRSYASAADDPQPGEDVFDVYSRARGTGINGVPYRAW